MARNKKEYLDIIYDVDKKPFTNYPNQLAKYLVDRYGLKRNSCLLDMGCGRGEFTNGFKKCGLNTFAVDQSKISNNYFPDLIVKVGDIERDGIPYPDNNFDIVYSKSVIEHFYNPKILVDEMYRVLKPGGMAITMSPAWEYNYKIFFEDYTHRSPFMLDSLIDIQKIAGFENVKAEYFRQLPSLWKYKFLSPLAELTRLLIPDNFYRNYSPNALNKWIKFSKEIMILSTSKKK